MIEEDDYRQHAADLVRLAQSASSPADKGRLLALAVDLGNRLLPVFQSPTGMPYVNVNLRTGRATGASG